MGMFIITLAAVLVYFLPAMIAISRRHLNAAAILMTNLLLGWTVLGWIIAIIWSLTNSHAAAGGELVAHGSAKSLKFTLALLMAIVLLILTMVGHRPVGVNDTVKDTVTQPAVKTGVPVPADELFGK